MITSVSIALFILVALMSVGVALPFCFGGALFYMTVAGSITMKGMMMTQSEASHHPHHDLHL